MSDLENKVALVTGAGRGIGRAIAIALAHAGCRVILSSRTQAQLHEVANAIRAGGGDALVVSADLTRDEDIQRLIDSVPSAWGAVDILVNNAGWGKRAPVIRAKTEDWDQTFRLNLRAPMILARSFLPGMIEKGKGAVINIGSVSGKTGEAEGAAYAASKFGLIGFTQSLYEEVREHGIKVSVILPGFVDTPMIPPVKHLDRARMIRPEDVAEAVLFIVNSSPTCCPVEMTVRPQQTPYR
jgi:NAD(P)-dependent dehydrogenase (short-subunit alcohol dehydrogenase family)